MEGAVTLGGHHDQVDVPAVREVRDAAAGVAFLHHSGDRQVGKLVHREGGELLLGMGLQAGHVGFDGVAAIDADPGWRWFHYVNQGDGRAVASGQSPHERYGSVASRGEIDGKENVAETHNAASWLGACTASAKVTAEWPTVFSNTYGKGRGGVRYLARWADFSLDSISQFAI